ncbi:glycine zipper 2TM domain-containing protein [Frischella sp. Ac48]|nr:glycine zipper 2TM domain-containing protein [Frischella sp. Ac48]
MTFTCLALMLTACQNSDIYSGDVYTADQAKQVQQIDYGKVVSARPVKIQTNASNGSSNSVIGSVGGAIIGGFIGNTIGSGTGNKLAIASGAIGGALLGNKAQDLASQTNAVELVILRDSGDTILIVQKATANQFHVGQQVRIVTNGKQISVAPRIN